MKNIKQPETAKPAKRGRRLWHPAFVEAFKMELFPWKDLFDFEAEYQLNAAPFIVDILIRKKRKDAVIGNSIAAIFRGFNIIEYKSPHSHVSISDFHKVCGYARLYAALNKVDARDITITFVEDRYPRKLFGFLREMPSFTVVRKRAGIYYIEGDMMPIQVINRKRLSADGNLWLRSLGDDLSIREFDLIDKELRKNPTDDSISAYVHVLLEANAKTVEEYYRMNKDRVTLNQVFERLGLTKEWETRGIAIGESRGIAIGENRGLAIGKSEGIAIGEARAAAERERLRQENERLRRELEQLRANA
jgi:hypothetical protein